MLHLLYHLRSLHNILMELTNFNGIYDKTVNLGKKNRLRDFVNTIK